MFSPRRYLGPPISRGHTASWLHRRRGEQEQDTRRERKAGLRSFRVVAGQIRTGQRLTEGIQATLKGRLLTKCDLPPQLEERAARCLDWTLPLARRLARTAVVEEREVGEDGEEAGEREQEAMEEKNRVKLVKEVKVAEVESDEESEEEEEDEDRMLDSGLNPYREFLDNLESDEEEDTVRRRVVQEVVPSPPGRRSDGRPQVLAGFCWLHDWHWHWCFRCFVLLLLPLLLLFLLLFLLLLLLLLLFLLLLLGFGLSSSTYSRRPGDEALEEGEGREGGGHVD